MNDTAVLFYMYRTAEPVVLIWSCHAYRCAIFKTIYMSAKKRRNVDFICTSLYFLTISLVFGLLIDGDLSVIIYTLSVAQPTAQTGLRARDPSPKTPQQIINMATVCIRRVIQPSLTLPTHEVMLFELHDPYNDNCLHQSSFFSKTLKRKSCMFNFCHDVCVCHVVWQLYNRPTWPSNGYNDVILRLPNSSLCCVTRIPNCLK